MRLTLIWVCAGALPARALGGPAAAQPALPSWQRGPPASALASSRTASTSAASQWHCPLNGGAHPSGRPAAYGAAAQGMPASAAPAGVPHPARSLDFSTSVQAYIWLCTCAGYAGSPSLLNQRLPSAYGYASPGMFSSTFASSAHMSGQHIKQCLCWDAAGHAAQPAWVGMAYEQLSPQWTPNCSRPAPPAAQQYPQQRPPAAAPPRAQPYPFCHAAASQQGAVSSPQQASSLSGHSMGPIQLCIHERKVAEPGDVVRAEWHFSGQASGGWHGAWRGLAGVNAHAAAVGSRVAAVCSNRAASVPSASA